MNNILITGGAGFIGSNFIPYFINKHQNYRIINLDKLTYAANLNYLKEVEHHPRYTFIKGDICDQQLVQAIFSSYNIKGVIHFAAESHVDNSIAEPDIFIKSNVNGTFMLINTAKNFWMNKPFTYKNNYLNCRFLHVSTDEVYGSLGKTGSFSEKSSYAPNSPYSASKASSDMIVRSYHKTYGLNIAISHSSNNYGPKQHHEKLIPTIIYKVLNNEKIPIYGDGQAVRDWLHVLDHCYALDLIYHQAQPGEHYNIGADHELSNIKLTQTICQLLDKIKPRTSGQSYQQLITFVDDRPGHDLRYAIDASKIKKDLNWQKSIDFNSGLRDTIEWYLNISNRPHHF